MAVKQILTCAAALLHVQSGLAVPVANEFPSIVLKRGNITVDPPADPTPIISELQMTEQELEQYIEEMKGTLNKRGSRTQELAPRETGTDGALLTYVEGAALPGSGQTGCEDFSLSGPFTSIHFLMGSSTVRHVSATSYSGNTTDVGNTDDVVDAGEFKFTDNERITKFSVGQVSGVVDVTAFTFETDAGNKYESLSSNIKDGTTTATYTDLSVGSGILARITGTYCDTGVMGSIGFDFLDELDSIAITDIDYSGFTDNIMPTGAGTQMSVGSQILDNRNSSEKQTITLTTTDAITRQTTVTTQIRAQVGGSVSVEAGTGIPLLAEGKVTTEANWQIEALSSTQEMSNAITTRAGTFALVCPAGKFCTARAFFTQFKMDVDVNATFTATAKSGSTFSWVQSGTYNGADSLSMQFNVTEVDNES
ncbi:hypothetical protein N0V82_001449 [Gnomoniopsis sp. IMI 355080]|nr:hypothetical protein N0V82_001449 [Gnomoniopsis sp. IMI 355080]